MTPKVIKNGKFTTGTLKREHYGSLAEVEKTLHKIDNGNFGTVYLKDGKHRRLKGKRPVYVSSGGAKYLDASRLTEELARRHVSMGEEITGHSHAFGCERKNGFTRPLQAKDLSKLLSKNGEMVRWLKEVAPNDYANLSPNGLRHGFMTGSSRALEDNPRLGPWHATTVSLGHPTKNICDTAYYQLDQKVHGNT